jgi:hypothetical protein
MKNGWKIAGAILAIGIYTAVRAAFPLQAYAECAAFAIEDALASDAAIFAGKVLRVEPEHRGAREDFVLFEVERVWKGPRDSQIILRNASQFDNQVSSIDLQFVEGETYLVFAYEHEGQLRTNQCQGTTFLDSAGKYLAVLGEGERPTHTVNLLDSMPSAAPNRASVSASMDSTDWWSASAIWWLAAAIPVLFAVWFRFKRKRR